MPNWLTFVFAVVGSGGVASFIIPIVNHKLQQRRDLEREAREARAAHIDRKRQMCLDLLESLSRLRSLAGEMRSLHDDRASRPGSRGQLKLKIQQFPEISATVHRFRRELDLEPNAHLQKAIDQWGSAGITYGETLQRAMISPWNPLKIYIGKAPQGEVNRLAADFDARTQALQDAVRTYVASLEASDKESPARRNPKLPLPRPPRREDNQHIDVSASQPS